jgi:hypothetical protein
VRAYLATIPARGGNPGPVLYHDADYKCAVIAVGGTQSEIDADACDVLARLLADVAKLLRTADAANVFGRERLR